MEPIEYYRDGTGEIILSRTWCTAAEIIRQTGSFLVYSSIYLALAASGMALTCSMTQNIQPTISSVLVLSLVVFSVYNMNRKTDEAEDALNHAERFRFTKTFERHLCAAALAAYGIALSVAALHGVYAFAVTTVPLLCGILYSVPVLPRGWKYRRLKEIPLMKNMVVSIAWAFSFSLVPPLITASQPGPATLVTFLFIFAWTFIASVLPDIRDRAGDEATGVTTLPVILGVGRCRALLTAINFLSGILIFAVGHSVLSPAVMIVILVSLLYSQTCILMVERTRHNDFIIDVISDGQFLAIGMVCVVLCLGFLQWPAPVFPLI